MERAEKIGRSTEHTQYGLLRTLEILIMGERIGELAGLFLDPKNSLLKLTLKQLTVSVAEDTGCSTITAPTLILNNVFISGPIIKPFNSMKVEIGRICLVYRTSCHVQYFSINDHHQFWQKMPVLLAHSLPGTQTPTLKLLLLP